MNVLKIIILISLVTLASATPTFAQTARSGLCTSAVGAVAEALKLKVGCEAPPDANIPVNSGGPAGPCQDAPPPPGDIRAAIISKWGITLNITQEQLPFAWKEFYQIDCTGFLQDIRGAIVGSWGNGYAQQFACPGGTGEYGSTSVMFSNQWSGEFMEAILTHELTHVWQFCTARGEQNRLEIPAAYSGEGGVSRYSREGCGYSSGFPSLYNEDHADTIALYLNPNVGELTCGNGDPNPFSGGRHPLHAGVAKRGLGR
ncbi:hypothetical protein BH09PAT1_BH09PAT1_1320 [soil metagenome]